MTRTHNSDKSVIDPADVSSDTLNRGLAAVYSGANSIASALPLLDGRDPTGNQ